MLQLFKTAGSIFIFDDLGLSALLAVLPNSLKMAIHGEWHGLLAMVRSLFGLDSGLAWGVALFTFVLLLRAHLKIKNKLDEFIGSKEIKWKITADEKSNTGFHLNGFVYNGGETIINAIVRLISIVSADGKTSYGSEMDLYWGEAVLLGGSAAKKQDLQNGGNYKVFIAHSTDRDRIRHEKMEKHVARFTGAATGGGELAGEVPPGNWVVTLRLLGNNLNGRECRIKLKIKDGSESNCFEVGKIHFDKYPLTIS